MAPHVKSSEIIQIAKLLSEYVKPTGVEGHVEYLNGYDDTRIAAMVGTHLSHASVAKIRLENFGKLISRDKDSRVDVLTDQLASVKADLADLTARYNKLIETLAINKVADVRHLKQRINDGNAPMLVRAAG